MSGAYYVMHGETQRGPFTMDQLRNLWSLGQVTSETLYWEEGLEQWEPLGTLAEWLKPDDVPAPAYSPQSIALHRTLRLQKEEKSILPLRLLLLAILIPATFALGIWIGFWGILLGTMLIAAAWQAPLTRH